MIKITLRVKFRAFGITLGYVNRTVEFDPTVSQVIMDERGVYVKVEA
jgi:hypothetical protein